MRITAVPLLAVGVLIVGCGGGSSNAKRSSALSATSPSPSSTSGTSSVAASSSGGSIAAQDASAKSTARSVVTAMEACFVDTQSYKGCETASAIKSSLGASAPPLGSGPGQVEIQATNQTYAITYHSQSGNTFKVTKDAQGSLRRTCTGSNSAGGCRGGTW